MDETRCLGLERERKYTAKNNIKSLKIFTFSTIISIRQNILNANKSGNIARFVDNDTLSGMVARVNMPYYSKQQRAVGGERILRLSFEFFCRFINTNRMVFGVVWISRD